MAENSARAGTDPRARIRHPRLASPPHTNNRMCLRRRADAVPTTRIANGGTMPPCIPSLRILRKYFMSASLWGRCRRPVPAASSRSLRRAAEGAAGRRGENPDPTMVRVVLERLVRYCRDSLNFDDGRRFPQGYFGPLTCFQSPVEIPVEKLSILAWQLIRSRMNYLSLR